MQMLWLNWVYSYYIHSVSVNIFCSTSSTSLCHVPRHCVDRLPGIDVQLTKLSPFILLFAFATSDSAWNAPLSDLSVSLCLTEYRGTILLANYHGSVSDCWLSGKGRPRELVRQMTIQEVQHQPFSNKQFQWWEPHRSLTHINSNMFLSLI